MLHEASMPSIESEKLAERMRATVSLSWLMFSRKVGSELIKINKEASMQLQYAYLLQKLIPLIKFHKDEIFIIELETGVKVGAGYREIDILFSGSCAEGEHKIAIEMKCYRTLSSSGGKRGATDIFMKDVYFDLFLLEQYVKENYATEGVALIMNDMGRLVNPQRKNAKCWRYDISHGATFGSEIFDTPIGGEIISFELENCYSLNWKQWGKFWFLEAQGT